MKSVKQLIFAEQNPKNYDAPVTKDSDMDEVVAHMQGIIWRHDLPPFRNHGM